MIGTRVIKKVVSLEILLSSFFGVGGTREFRQGGRLGPFFFFLLVRVQVSVLHELYAATVYNRSTNWCQFT